MLGTATWTPLNGMVMLRPQFEHLDALRLQQIPGFRSTRFDEDNVHKRESKAEDVNMTVKDTEDDEPQDDLYGGMAETLKTLRAMAEEPWQRLQWVDSDVSLFPPPTCHHTRSHSKSTPGRPRLRHVDLHTHLSTPPLCPESDLKHDSRTIPRRDQLPAHRPYPQRPQHHAPASR